MRNRIGGVQLPSASSSSSSNPKPRRRSSSSPLRSCKNSPVLLYPFCRLPSSNSSAFFSSSPQRQRAAAAGGGDGGEEELGGGGGWVGGIEVPTSCQEAIHHHHKKKNPLAVGGFNPVSLGSPQLLSPHPNPSLQSRLGGVQKTPPPAAAPPPSCSPGRGGSRSVSSSGGEFRAPPGPSFSSSRWLLLPLHLCSPRSGSGRSAADAEQLVLWHTRGQE